MKKKMGLVKREEERIELEFPWESFQFKFWLDLYGPQVKTLKELERAGEKAALEHSKLEKKPATWIPQRQLA